MMFGLSGCGRASKLLGLHPQKKRRRGGSVDVEVKNGGLKTHEEHEGEERRDQLRADLHLSDRAECSS